MKYSLYTCIQLLLSFYAHAQTTMPLYDGEIPNSTRFHPNETWMHEDGTSFREVSNVSIPVITVFQPPAADANGVGVIIIPGGGYMYEKVDKEGNAIAGCFVKHGITAFVLTYRLPNDSTMIDKKYGPIEDAQRAIQFVRQQAAEYSVDTGKIGVMGFSAGGHLAAMVATQFDTAYISNPHHVNLRPNFMVLVNPVISMSEPLAHRWTRRQLLGDHPSRASVRQFSNELHVTARTPAAWITHASDDTTVSVRNSFVLLDAMKAKGVPVEMELVEKGGHDFLVGMEPEVWMWSLFRWMEVTTGADCK